MGVWGCNGACMTSRVTCVFVYFLPTDHKALAWLSVCTHMSPRLLTVNKHSSKQLEASTTTNTMHTTHYFIDAYLANEVYRQLFLGHNQQTHIATERCSVSTCVVQWSMLPCVWNWSTEMHWAANTPESVINHKCNNEQVSFAIHQATTITL